MADLHVRYAPLHGTTISGDLIVRAIDELPVIAVAAACSKGETVVSQAGELRHKESNRIGDLTSELKQLGVEIEETENGFEIDGKGQLMGGQVSSHGDHRLAMALAVAGLAAQHPVSILDAGIIAESFPGFSDSLIDLGAELHTEQ